LKSDGSFTYTPDPDTPFTGIDEFSYTIRTGNGSNPDFPDDFGTASGFPRPSGTTSTK
jgi:hypothetical protein